MNYHIKALLFFACLLGPLHAQSPPHQSRSGSRDENGKFYTNWDGVAGRSYFLQWSENLVDWHYFPLVEFGVGAKKYEIPLKNKPLFSRVKFIDDPSVTSLQEARDADFDQDGLPNHYEVNYRGLDVFNAADAPLDPDGDSLNSLQEFSLGTNPILRDTNNDGLTDGYALPGAVKMEVWNGIDTRNLSFLTSDPRFPHNPNAEQWLKRLEKPTNTGDYYGSRVRGFIIPSQTRDYVFYLTADDQSEFWLSTDHHSYNKVLLLNPDSSSLNVWNRFPEQKSTVIPLQAGVRYYFEILYKEFLSNDFFQVAWSAPSGSPAIIDAAHILSWQPDPEDTDDDALQNSWELANGLNPNDNGANNTTQGGYGDLDADGLSNFTEKGLNTNVLLADTDGDTFIDGVEHDYFKTSPLDAASKPAVTVSSDWQTTPIGTAIRPIAYNDASVASKQHLLAAGMGVEIGITDSFGFFHRSVTGDFSITMSYDKLDQAPGQVLANGAIACALMARESLSSDSRYAGALVRRALSAFNFVSRPGTAGLTARQENLVLPAISTKAWVRLVRQGNTFLAYASPDNATWSLVGQQTMDLPQTLYLGYGVYSTDILDYTSAVVQVTEWLADSDQDGISDSDEIAQGTSPNAADSDGDGYSDYEEIFEFFTDPIVADLQPESIADSNNGSESVGVLGDWIVDGSAIYVAGGRGAVEYDLTVSRDAIYRLMLSAESRSNQTSVGYYSIKVEVDGIYIGRLGLDDIEESPGSDGILTPWLTAGTHRVRFFVENSYAKRVLQINSVQMQFIGGADANLNGTPDWMDHRLLANNSVLNLALTNGVTESATSPFCLEGRSRYLGFTQADDALL